MEEKESTLKLLFQIKNNLEFLTDTKSDKSEIDQVNQNQETICKNISRILLMFMEILEF